MLNLKNVKIQFMEDVEYLDLPSFMDQIEDGDQKSTMEILKLNKMIKNINGEDIVIIPKNTKTIIMEQYNGEAMVSHNVILYINGLEFYFRSSDMVENQLLKNEDNVLIKVL